MQWYEKNINKMKDLVINEQVVYDHEHQLFRLLLDSNLDTMIQYYIKVLASL